MVNNLTTVTAAAAGTQAPSVPKSAAAATGKPGGNDASVVGQHLPPPADVATEAVERALLQLNEFMAQNRRSLRFQFDELSGRTIITVLDKETQEVVRQIPPPELLEIVRRLEQAGSLLDVVG
jgi:flagellar protein FlaG